MADEQHTKTYILKDSDRTSPLAEGGAGPAENQPAPAAGPRPVPEPAAPPSPPPPPPSQVELDIKEAGLTPEEALRASQALAAENERKAGGRSGTENLAVAARFRWLFLLILSLAATLTWAIETQYSGRPYHWTAWGLFLAAVILTLPTAKFLRLPTRAGLAALGWSAAFFISALYGPQDTIFNGIPAALPWAGLLTLIVLFAAVAIWRKVGRYKVIDLALALILIYAALSPLWSLIDNLSAGGALALKFEILSASPVRITSHLPWYLWPMTVMVLGILPLAALFSLWDQFSALRRKGARHGGNFFLALAFLGLMPYGFLCFDQAVSAQPGWAQALRAILPSASDYAREGGVEWSAPDGGAPIPSELAEPLTTPPEESPAETVATAEPETAAAPDEATEAAPAPTTEPAVPAGTSAPPPPPMAVEPEVPSITRAVPAPPASPESAGRQDLDARLRIAEQELSAALERIKALERKLDQLTAAPVPPPPPTPIPPAPEAAPPADRPWPESAPEPIPSPPANGDASSYSSTGAGRPSPPLPGLAI